MKLAEILTIADHARMARMALDRTPFRDAWSASETEVGFSTKKV